MAKQHLILIADDDRHIRQVIRFALEKAGFGVLEAGDGKEAVDIFNRMSPDLVVLDIVMPEMDGTEVCRSIRRNSDVPIIFLSSKDEEIDRILGLELGGDDYVTKPFSPRELVARVKAVLRRVPVSGSIQPGPSTNSPEEKVIGHGSLMLDTERFLASWNRHQVTLTVTEFNILRALLGHPGKVFTRDELMDRAYPTDTVVSDRTIDSHIRRIRQKFGSVGGDPIETVHGLGYKLASCSA